MVYAGEMAGESWRREHARQHARAWLHAPRDIVSAVLVGLVGGILTAATSTFPTWAAVLIGVGGAVVGAYLPWLAMYLVHWCRAGTVTTRIRLATLEAELDAHLNPAAQPVSSAKDALGELLSELLDGAEDFELFHDDSDQDEARMARHRVHQLEGRAEAEVRERLGAAELALMQAAVHSKADRVSSSYVSEVSADTVAWQCVRVQADWIKKHLKKM